MTVTINGSSGIVTPAIVTSGTEQVGNLTVTGAGAFGSNLTFGGSQVLTTTNGGLGYNQTWQNFPIGATPVTQRNNDITYTNGTGKPIMITVYATYAAPSVCHMHISINGGAYFTIGLGSNSSGGNFAVGHCIIPPGSTYIISITPGGTTTEWAELR